MKQGPNPKISFIMLDLIAAHIEVCQVGVGELSGKYIKRLFGAAINATLFQGKFSMESVWRTLRMKILMQHNHLCWTCKGSVDNLQNLDKWFTDAKADLSWMGLRLMRSC